MSSPLRAYVVTETYDNTGGIVFARSNRTARRLGANEYADGDIYGVLCYRAKFADWCADSGIVPASVMIEYGWHFECHGCGETIDVDWLEENNLPLEGVIGVQDSTVYCCAECKIRDDAVEAEKKRVGAEFLEALRELIRQRFGDIVFADSRDHVYVIHQEGNFSIGQASVRFEFPGMQVAAAELKYEWAFSFHWDGIGPVFPRYWVCHGDKEAFEAFAEATKQAELTDG